MSNILIVDDDRDFCLSLQRVLQHQGHYCCYCLNIGQGLQEARSGIFDLVFLDVTLPDGNGLSHLKSFQATPGVPEIIIITGHGDPDGAGSAIKNGAWDYIEKPVSLNNIKLILTRALKYREKKAGHSRSFDRSSIIGESGKISVCIEILAKASISRNNVLISGETGTGKELFARAIHENSTRKGKMIVIDCTNLPKTLAESLLFGHIKGSFTGAYDHQEGLFKQADGGTVFLDEVGEMNLSLQKSLLRVLQEKCFRPIGAKKEIHSDFRVIAATNRDLKKMAEKGQFRSDLYFRLNGLKIEIPPLRERLEDISLLTNHYVGKVCDEYRIPRKGVSRDFMDSLCSYTWPGNVRELTNVLYTAVDNAYDEPILYPHHLSLDIRIHLAKNSLQEREQYKRPRNLDPAWPVYQPPTSLEAGLGNGNSFLENFESFPSIKQVRELTINRMETEYLHELSKLCKGKVKQACRISGLSRARLYELMKKHSVSIVR
ncbi:MAG: sigma-54-dependent transcriptional regulator [Desulfovibrionales bacterium]